MASESINILISADDQASAQLKKVGGAVDNLGTRVKDMGGKTKASVEIVGTFANVLGGSMFGSAAGEIAQLTERVSAFSEVAKAGGVGAFALKAGLVAAAGIAAYKVGEVVGGWIAQTEKWQAQMDAAATQSAKLDARMADFAARRAAERKEDVDVARPGAERESAIAANLTALQAEKAGIDAQIDATKRLVEEGNKRRDAWTVDAAWNRGNRQAEAKMNQEQLEEQRAKRDALEKEIQSYRDLVGERAKALEAKREENAAKDKSDAFLKSLRDEIELLKASKAEQQAIEAARNTTPDQQGVAKALIEERDALKAKAEEQKKAELAADLAAKKEADAIERVAALEKKRMVDLEARRIELTKGREAAQAYRLEQDGLSKATSERLAAAEEQQRKDEEAAGKAKNAELDRSPQQATQGRLLTQGTGGDQMMQVAQAQVTGIKQLNIDLGRKLDRIYEASKERGTVINKLVVP